jgi:hypothetical protein
MRENCPRALGCNYVKRHLRQWIAVIVVDAANAARSHIVSPQLLPYAWRNKFSTLIGDVATTGNSGSGVFDPNRKCLLGITKIHVSCHDGR